MEHIVLIIYLANNYYLAQCEFGGYVMNLCTYILELPYLLYHLISPKRKTAGKKKKLDRYQHNVALVSQEGKVKNFMVTNVETVTT